MCESRAERKPESNGIEAKTENSSQSTTEDLGRPRILLGLITRCCLELGVLPPLLLKVAPQDRPTKITLAADQKHNITQSHWTGMVEFKQSFESSLFNNNPPRDSSQAKSKVTGLEW